MKNPPSRVRLLPLLLLCAPAFAAEPAIEESLLGPAGYPKHSCVKPDRPNLPAEVKTQGEVMMYEALARQYNQKAQLYTTCINAYLKTAGDDARHIQTRMDEAVAEANAR